jgi:hypothetical protein
MLQQQLVGNLAAGGMTLSTDFDTWRKPFTMGRTLVGLELEELFGMVKHGNLVGKGHFDTGIRLLDVTFGGFGI